MIWNPWKIFGKEFIFSKTLGLLPVVLLKKLLHRYFSRGLIIDMKISIFTERLSVAAFSANRCDTDVVIRNFRKMRYRTISISIQYRTNDESAATINNFRHIKNYIPFIWHLSRFHFTSSYNVLFFSNCVYYFVLFSLTCTTMWTVQNMFDDLIQKK